jgi:hypothetical protein
MCRNRLRSMGRKLASKGPFDRPPQVEVSKLPSPDHPIVSSTHTFVGDAKIPPLDDLPPFAAGGWLVPETRRGRGF